MREADWQVMDKDQIIDLIIKHNASTEPLKGDHARRVQAKLENMDVSALWKHIFQVYDGVLYEPDSVLVDPIELRRREAEYARIERERKKTRAKAKTIYNIAPIVDCNDQKHDAHTFFYGKDYVRNVFETQDGLIVLTTKPSKCAKLAVAYYPHLRIEVLKMEEGV